MAILEGDIFWIQSFYLYLFRISYNNTI